MLSDSDVEALSFVPPPIENSRLKRLNSPTQIVYSSAIAHQLAISAQQPAARVAAQIADEWTRCLDQPACWQTLPIPAAVLPNLSIRATAAGLVQIELGDRAIAGWLEMLIQPADSTGKGRSQPLPAHIASNPPVFSGQHAHARCCSLLRLADREGLMTLDQRDGHPQDWQITTPEPIPWLTSAGQLWLQDAADRRLICQLFAVWDEFARSSSLSNKVILRLADDVTQAFQSFHRAHAMFGKADPIQVTQTQLALLLATQRILLLLLEEGLQVSAPIEL